VNFAPALSITGPSPPGLPPGPAAPYSTWAPLLKKSHLRVSIEDLMVEDDKAVVRNHWTGTDARSKQRLEFYGIVIGRIATADRRARAYWRVLTLARLASGA